MRQIKPTDGAGPWRGGPSRCPGRRGYSSAGESRASWHDDGYWVGTCASRHPPRRAPDAGADRSGLSSNAARTRHRADNLRRLGPDLRQGNPRSRVEGVDKSATVLVSVIDGHPRSFRPVVHTLWTTVWMRAADWDGGAGERYRTGVDGSSATAPGPGI